MVEQLHPNLPGNREKDYYEILGVSRFSSRQDVVWAYKAIVAEYESALKTFKDAGKPLPQRHIEQLTLITQAYKTLIDNEAREEYNKSLPKYLRRWDTETELRVPKATVQEFLNAGGGTSSQVPFAWGTFGEVSRIYRSAALEILTPTTSQSISHMITRKARIVNALLSFFGIC